MRITNESPIEPMLEAASIQNIGVVGAGIMGSGIVQVFLGAGCTVHLHDVDTASVDRARERIKGGLERWQSKKVIPDAAEAFARLHVTRGLMDLQSSDWVVEAIIEEPEAKAEILRTLGRLCRPETVLASNTSSISITQLGTASGRPERTIGMHFFNPPPVMRLVEVVPGLRTSPKVLDATRALVERLGKVPIVSKDRPGFLSNRILAPMLNEAFHALEQGVGTAADIDQVMKLGMNHPMGPLELADFIGLDVCLAILEVLHREFGDSKYHPCPLLRKYVEAGWLGKKAGRGFYEYPG